METREIPEDLANRFGFPPLAFHAEVARQGNFTAAFLYDTENYELVSFGIAKRSVNDEERPECGERLAIARALRQLRVQYRLGGIKVSGR